LGDSATLSSEGERELWLRPASLESLGSWGALITKANREKTAPLQKKRASVLSIETKGLRGHHKPLKGRIVNKKIEKGREKEKRGESLILKASGTGRAPPGSQRAFQRALSGSQWGTNFKKKRVIRTTPAQKVIKGNRRGRNPVREDLPRPCFKNRLFGIGGVQRNPPNREKGKSDGVRNT